MDVGRQKRNKPCENCRNHRRKCIHYNNSICERCFKLNLECIYIISEKPIKSPTKTTIPVSKGKKLIEAILHLEEEIDGLQLELSRLNAQPQVKTLPPASNQNWALTIKKDNCGIHVETTIRSVQDLSLFISQVLSTVLQPIRREFVFANTPAGDQFLRVRRDNKNAENIFRQFFSNRNTAIVKESPPPILQNISILKSQYVDHFFNCHHFSLPIFVYHYHYPLLASNPDSLLSTAVAAFVAYSPCIHVSQLKYRLQFAELCRSQTREKLQDLVFTPNIYTCVALYFLSYSSLFALKGSEARLQSSLCWNMVTIIESKEFSAIEFEVWKRLYHAERYLEFNMSMLYDGSTDFSDITFAKSVGVPSPLPELDDKITVLCFQSLTKLLTNASRQDSTVEVMGLRLMAAVIDVIPSNYIELLERSLLELWDNVPEEIKLGQGPYCWMESVDECQHPAILRFNASYYIYWMNFQSRVMQQPHKTDLTGTMLSRIDEDRALLIASICSDAVTKIFARLAEVSPCAIEVHWLTMCVDILNLLGTSMNQAVRKRARENLELLIQVLKMKLSSVIDAPFINRIARMISRYMDANKICDV